MGMSSDLTARNSSLDNLLRVLADGSPNTIAMGEAFEYVADLALWSSPEFGARIKHIWRWEDWPGAQGRDLGIDVRVKVQDMLDAMGSGHP
jgi:predicted helicase